MPRIKGGFYLKAKCVQESWIAKAPPHVREIWDLFLRKAFYADGKKIKIGQLLVTYKDIIEELSWFVGYRKVTYKKHHCEIAMKALVKAAMITTTKTTRGVIVTVLNYSKYQNIKNYECYSESYTKATTTLQPTATIEKEEKEEKPIVEKPHRQRIPYEKIVSFFNETTGKNYKHTTNGTKSHIKARINEGFTFDDFKAVILAKSNEWQSDPKMEQYLRPATLFGAKFESYLQSSGKQQPEAWDG